MRYEFCKLKKICNLQVLLLPQKRYLLWKLLFLHFAWLKY
jgi:hypothetical protein